MVSLIAAIINTTYQDPHELLFIDVCPWREQRSRFTCVDGALEQPQPSHSPTNSSQPSGGLSLSSFCFLDTSSPTNATFLPLSHFPINNSGSSNDSLDSKIDQQPQLLFFLFEARIACASSPGTPSKQKLPWPWLFDYLQPDFMHYSTKGKEHH